MHYLLIPNGLWLFVPWLAAVALWWVREFRIAS